MKKHWLKTVLAIVAVLALTGAWLSWIGSMPFGRPETEPEFMAEQLRRVRYGGPLRGETEKAIAEVLPDSPTVDDLRLAYYHQLQAQLGLQAKGILETRPEWAGPQYPPQDVEAHRRMTAVAKRCAELERGRMYERGLKGLERFEDVADRDAYLRATEDIDDVFDGVVPKPGHCLERWSPETGIEFTGGMALYRVAVTRAYALKGAGRTADALALLRSAAHAAVHTVWNTLATGELFRQLAILLVYQDGVLFFADMGFAGSEWLEEVGAFRPASRLEVANVLRTDLALQIAETSAQAWHGDPELMKVMGKATCEEDFDRYGATSLHDWAEKRLGTAGRGYWDIRLDLYQRLVDTNPDLSHPDQARRYFEGESDNSAAAVAHFKDVAMLAAAEVESDALLLATRMHALRLRDPATWREQAMQAGSAYPMLRVVATERGIEIWADKDHPTLSRSFAPKDVIATVLEHSDG